MAVALSINVKGIPEIEAMLGRLNPRENPKWVGDSLVDCALLTQKITTEEKIIRGGRFRGPKGPRGGKGKMGSAGAHPTKVTSRHGRLRDSIAVNRSPLPWAVEVGSDVKYAAVHEFGGSVGVRSTTVKSHTRTVAFGRKVGIFTVPSHFRSGHYADYPARPYLGPGLDKASRSFSDIFIRKLQKYLP